MKTSSAKAKGRRLQQYVAEKIKLTFSLPDSDVKSIPMGSQGADVWLSDNAQTKFPFAVECKAQEKINIWEAFFQAQEHANKHKVDLQTVRILRPIVVFTRNRDEVLCCIKFEDLLEILKR